MTREVSDEEAVVVADALESEEGANEMGRDVVGVAVA